MEVLDMKKDWDVVDNNDEYITYDVNGQTVYQYHYDGHYELDEESFDTIKEVEEACSFCDEDEDYYADEDDEEYCDDEEDDNEEYYGDKETKYKNRWIHTDYDSEGKYGVYHHDGCCAIYQRNSDGVYIVNGQEYEKFSDAAEVAAENESEYEPVFSESDYYSDGNDDYGQNYYDEKIRYKNRWIHANYDSEGEYGVYHHDGCCAIYQRNSDGVYIVDAKECKTFQEAVEIAVRIDSNYEPSLSDRENHIDEKTGDYESSQGVVIEDQNQSEEWDKRWDTKELGKNTKVYSAFGYDDIYFDRVQNIYITQGKQFKSFSEAAKNASRKTDNNVLAELIRKQNKLRYDIYDLGYKSGLSNKLDEPIADGISDENGYLNADLRISIVDKETGEKKKDTDGAGGYEIKNFWKKNKLPSPTVKCADKIAAILEGKIENISDENIKEYEKNDDFALASSNYINISKMPGKMKTDTDDLIEKGKIWSGIVKEQMKVAKSDIVYCGGRGVLKSLAETLDFEPKENLYMGNNALIKGIYNHDGAIYIDGCHPSYIKGNNLDFFNEIKKIREDYKNGLYSNEDIMVCPRCKAECSMDSFFCSECGNKL